MSTKEKIQFVVALTFAVFATTFTAVEPDAFRVCCVAVMWFNMGIWVKIVWIKV